MELDHKLVGTTPIIPFAATNLTYQCSTIQEELVKYPETIIEDSDLETDE